MWQETIQCDPRYYVEEYQVPTSAEKIRSRVSNSEQRISIAKRTFDLNDLCDLGCAEGTFLEALSSKGYRNIIGLEPNQSAVDYAKKKGLDVHLLSETSLLELCASKKINAITAFHVIEHVPDPLEFLSSIYSSLPSGGYVMLETPNVESPSIKRHNYNNILVHPEHIFLLSPKSLAALLNKTGLTIIARGRRDFDGQNMAIGTSLERLGFRTKKDAHPSIVSIRNDAPRSLPQQKKIRFPMIRKLVSKILHSLVVLLHREEYMWVIAQKR